MRKEIVFTNMYVLEDAPAGTVVLTWDGRAAQLESAGSWDVAGIEGRFENDEIIAAHGPLLLLHTPRTYDMAPTW